MVVFTCNYCGESLQKPRVEKHYSFTCRQEKFLTCVDCFKDFRGNEYNAHTKCVTEEERYSGKDFVQKVRKGEVKQESWMETIKSIIKQECNLSQHYKNLLNTISHYNNVPRKKAKFINFIKSSTGGKTNISDIEGIWNIIDKYKMQGTSMKENNIKNTDKIEAESTLEDSLKYNKRKINDEECIDYIHNTNETVHKKRKNGTNSCNDIDLCHNNEVLEEDKIKFSYSNCIEQVLMVKQCISKRKLYKKILKKYQNRTGKSITQDEIERKVNKKLKKMNVEIQNDYITLKL